MKLTYYFSESAGLLLERLEGKLDMKNVMQAFQQLWKDPNYQKDVDVLMDTQDIEIQFGKEAIATFIGFFNSMPQAAAGKLVVVVDAPIETAIAMMYQMEVGTDSIKIFSTLEDAFTYLEVDMEIYDALDSDLATVIEVD